MNDEQVTFENELKRLVPTENRMNVADVFYRAGYDAAIASGPSGARNRYRRLAVAACLAASIVGPIGFFAGRTSVVHSVADHTEANESQPVAARQPAAIDAVAASDVTPLPVFKRPIDRWSRSLDSMRSQPDPLATLTAFNRSSVFRDEISIATASTHARPSDLKTLSVRDVDLSASSINRTH
ncbi:MAG: hypothetical protein WBD31_13260 [Rubripirellula sp.]